MLLAFTVPLALLISTPLPSGQASLVADNAEIQALFAADQSVRSSMKSGQGRDRASIEKMIADDRARRAAARQLLDKGALRTASDFYAAAFLFQHGMTADDYLLAHSLALVAVARGKADATWIATATLDRYLQKIGQKQIYGTQFIVSKEDGPTMGAYDAALVPDTLRVALGVPSRQEQDARLAAMKTSVPPTR